MKKTLIQLKSILLIALGICMFSCNNDLNDESGIFIPPAGGIPVSFQMNTQAETTALKCYMYIFSEATNGAGYVLKDSILLNSQGSTTIAMAKEEWNDENYRFLFIANPAGNREIIVINKDGNSLQINDNWNNIMFLSANQKLSGDNFYGIVDKSRIQLFSENRIAANLNRMVGQMALDIFRIVSRDDATAIDIDPAVASTVLDRVYKMDVQCEGMSKAVILDAAYNLKDTLYWGTPYVETFTVRNDDNLHAVFPQDRIVASSTGKNGAVRFNGNFCLPATQNIRLKVTFHYYDTTPTCGTNHSGNTPDLCFSQQTLTLNIPQTDDDSKLLNVKPNYYTVTNTKIRFNRIIDLAFAGTYDFVTDWNIE